MINMYIINSVGTYNMCPFYSMIPVKNAFMSLAIMYQPVEDGSYKASNIIHRCASALRLLCLCHATPPTAVGGAHNSPIANATMILESGLVHYTGYIYITKVGSFTSPGIGTR